MIPFIRSHNELMVITQPKDQLNESQRIKEDNIYTEDSGQRKRYIRSIKKEEVDLPDLPKRIRHKWINNKEAISKFINDLDYNNQIQSSYDLTLLESQSKRNQRDIA